MKEEHGRITSWDAVAQRGTIEDSNGTRYTFSSREWKDDEPPEVDGHVLVICENGRDASQMEYLGIEHLGFLKITTRSADGEVETVSHSRFLGGPWRVRSDALMWMAVAKGLHLQNKQFDIEDLSDLLKGEHPAISLRGSVIKYCYGLAIELYLKWIMIEAGREYKSDHRLPALAKKIPDPVLDRLRGIYAQYMENSQPEFKITEAHVSGVEKLSLDWSTFDKFVENIHNQKFIVGRYADPKEYGIFQSRSSNRSREMNSYMDSDDFFLLGERLLAYKPDPKDYE
jgi:hypothetical protein